MVEARAILDLQQEAELLLRALRVIGDSAEARGAGHPRDAAYAPRRKAHGRDCSRGFLAVLHVRDEQRLRTDIEVPLDEDLVVPRGTHDGRNGVGGDDLELRERGVDLVRRVLGVDDEPVEAGSRDDLRAVRARERYPQADLLLPGDEGVLERIARQVHWRRVYR